MTPAGDARRALRRARAAVGAVGAALVGLALFADVVGLGRPDGVGTGQVLLGLGGLALIAIAVLGRRAVRLHVALAVTLLNALILLAGLELAAIAAARAGLVGEERLEEIAAQADSSYYAQQTWGADYWSEALRAESYVYEPYSTWRHAPFDGSTINVSEAGVRATPGADCRAGSHRVFGFGGSTLWGWGAPDWGTIAAYVQGGLAERVDGPVCVVNWAEDAYVSTQGVITLLRRLQVGDVPDAVFFYDGVNEVFAAYQSGRADSHLDFERIAGLVEGRRHPLLVWIESTRLHWLWTRIASRGDDARSRADRPEAPDAELAAAVVEAYVANYRAVAALAREWGFEFHFFWQPHLAVGDRPLREEERVLRSRLDARVADLAADVYARVRREASRRDRLWYLAPALDGVPDRVWIDEWGHVTPPANRLLAERIVDALVSDAREGRG